MYVSLGIFTQYRRELMGVATVLILLCHSLLPPAIHCPNDILRWIIITGNRGVDIFLFLSGLGMYHSLRKMTKWNRGGVIRWYAKRYRHILLPYLLICFPYYLVLGCVNDGHFSISIFLYRLSTLNYWLEHKGFWYIAMLIPLYFLTPFYARIIDKTKYQTLLTVTLCIILLLISTIKIENNNLFSHVWNNTAFVLQRIPSYLIGYYMAPSILKGKKVNLLKLTGIIAGCFLVIKIIRLCSYRTSSSKKAYGSNGYVLLWGKSR